MNVRCKAYIQLSGAMMIVGSSVVLGKVLATGLPVFIATALSLLVAAAILVPLAHAKKEYVRLKKCDYAILFAQALFGIVLFRVLLFAGLHYLNAADAGIIASTTPAIIALVSCLYLKERLGIPKAVGIVISVVGILWIQLISPHTALNEAGSRLSLRGGILISGSVVAEALFSVLAKSLSPGITPLLSATAVTIFGLVLTLPLAIYQALDFSIRWITLGEWGGILYYGAIVTVFSFMLWFSGLQKVAASTAGNFTGFVPVSSMWLSHYFLAEPIGLSHLIGAACVIAGNILTCQTRWMKPFEKSEPA